MLMISLLSGMPKIDLHCWERIRRIGSKIRNWKVFALSLELGILFGFGNQHRKDRTDKLDGSRPCLQSQWNWVSHQKGLWFSALMLNYPAVEGKVTSWPACFWRCVSPAGMWNPTSSALPCLQPCFWCPGKCQAVPGQLSIVYANSFLLFLLLAASEVEVPLLIKNRYRSSHPNLNSHF